MSRCASSVIPNCPQREQGGCCLKPDGTLDCLHPDASIPPDLLMSIPDAPLDMSIEPPVDLHTPPAEDKSPPVDFTLPPDMSIPSVDVSNKDLVVCGFLDQQFIMPINDFANALAAAQNAGESYYVSVQTQAKPLDGGILDAGVVPSNCIRLCNSGTVLSNPPCRKIKCDNLDGGVPNAPLGGVLSIVLHNIPAPDGATSLPDGGLPLGIQLWDVFNGGVNVGEVSARYAPLLGTDGGIQFIAGIAITVPDAQMCSCYYLFNTSSCNQ